MAVPSPFSKDRPHPSCNYFVIFCNFIVIVLCRLDNCVFKQISPPPFVNSVHKNNLYRNLGTGYEKTVYQDSIPLEMRYFLTMRATLKVMASSNSRKSKPVSFLIFSRR